MKTTFLFKKKDEVAIDDNIIATAKLNPGQDGDEVRIHMYELFITDPGVSVNGVSRSGFEMMAKIGASPEATPDALNRLVEFLVNNTKSSEIRVKIGGTWFVKTNEAADTTVVEEKAESAPQKELQFMPIFSRRR